MQLENISLEIGNTHCIRVIGNPNGGAAVPKQANSNREVSHYKRILRKGRVQSRVYTA
jgi:hypothetical protein